MANATAEGIIIDKDYHITPTGDDSSRERVNALPVKDVDASYRRMDFGGDTPNMLDNKSLAGEESAFIECAGKKVLRLRVLYHNPTGTAQLRAVEKGYGGDPGRLYSVGITAENLTIERLADITLPDATNWDVTGDFATPATGCVYTHSAGSGTLTEVLAKQANALIGGRTYMFRYTISAVTAVGALAAEITTGVATAVVALDLSAGTHTVYFTSKASPGDFVISGSSDTAADSFKITDVSLALDTDIVGGGYYPAEGLEHELKGGNEVAVYLESGSAVSVWGSLV